MRKPARPNGIVRGLFTYVDPELGELKVEAPVDLNEDGEEEEGEEEVAGALAAHAGAGAGAGGGAGDSDSDEDADGEAEGAGGAGGSTVSSIHGDQRLCFAILHEYQPGSLVAGSRTYATRSLNLTPAGISVQGIAVIRRKVRVFPRFYADTARNEVGLNRKPADLGAAVQRLHHVAVNFTFM